MKKNDEWDDLGWILKVAREDNLDVGRVPLEGNEN